MSNHSTKIVQIITVPKHILCILKPPTWITGWIILFKLLKIYITSKSNGNLQQWLQYSKITVYCFKEPISCFISSRSLKHLALWPSCMNYLFQNYWKNKIHTDLNLRNVTVLLYSPLQVKCYVEELTCNINPLALEFSFKF
jgi:hypothetical protein